MSKIWPLFAAVTVFACGCGAKEGRAKHAGQTVGETLTDFATGVGSGVDQALKVDVQLSEKLTTLGLSRTVAKTVSIGEGRRGLTVYIKSQRQVTIALTAKAMDANDEEIGRATVDVEFADDDAKYITFPFQSEMDADLVRRYLIDVRPTPTEPNDMPTSAKPEAEQQE